MVIFYKTLEHKITFLATWVGGGAKRKRSFTGRTSCLLLLNAGSNQSFHFRLSLWCRNGKTPQSLRTVPHA